MFAGKDEGGVTVLAALVLLAVITVSVMVVQVGSVVAARHRVQAAADLSAIGAARALDRGEEQACDLAAILAERGGARVQECRVEGWDVVVTVTAPVFLGRFGVPEASASARAGPA